MAEKKEKDTSRSLAAQLIYAALSTLRDGGKEMASREVYERVGKTVKLDAWAQSRYEKTGYVRWHSILSFYSIDCVKAGYLVKKRGVWYITPEGEAALKLGAEKLLDEATKAYRQWKLTVPAVEKEEEPAKEVQATFDDIEQKAIEGIKAFINAKNPYEFQDLTAALLRAMGYHTPFVAPRGKDGGVDIVAYRDPLGTESPRIQVQIKHRDSAASVQEVRQLMGLLQKVGDVGIFVSSGGFTSDAKNAAKGSHVHVELIDQDRFVELWQGFYEKMADEDKRLLPMRTVYLLASDE